MTRRPITAAVLDVLRQADVHDAFVQVAVLRVHRSAPTLLDPAVRSALDAAYEKKD